MWAEESGSTALTMALASSLVKVNDLIRGGSACAVCVCEIIHSRKVIWLTKP